MRLQQELLITKKKNKHFSDEQIEKVHNLSFLELKKRRVAKSKILVEAKQQKRIFEQLEKYIIEKATEVGMNVSKGNLFEKNILPGNTFCTSLNKDDSINTSVGWNNGKVDSTNCLNKLQKKLGELAKEQTIELGGIEKGELGEQRISDALAMYRRKYLYRENVLIPADGVGRETSETDVYIVTPKGVCVCEVKNWGKRGQTITISKDGQWTITNEHGAVASKHSPIEQNNSHCLATEQFLEDQGLPSIRMIPIIFIANNEVTINNQSSNAIMRISELYNYLNDLNTPETVSREQQEQIIEAFDDCKNLVSERAFEIYSISEEEEAIKKYVDTICEYYKDEIVWRKAVYDIIAKKESILRKKDVLIAIISLISMALISFVSLPVFQSIMRVLRYQATHINIDGEHEVALEGLIIVGLIQIGVYGAIIIIVLLSIKLIANNPKKYVVNRWVLMVLTIALIVAGCMIKPYDGRKNNKIKLSDYVEYSLNGVDGKGTLEVGFNKKALMQDINRCSKKYISDTNQFDFDYEVSQTENLSNGSKVIVTFLCNDYPLRWKYNVNINKKRLVIPIKGLFHVMSSRKINYNDFETVCSYMNDKLNQSDIVNYIFFKDKEYDGFVVRDTEDYNISKIVFSKKLIYYRTTKQEHKGTNSNAIIGTCEFDATVNGIYSHCYGYIYIPNVSHDENGALKVRDDSTIQFYSYPSEKDCINNYKETVNNNIENPSKGEKIYF